MKYWLLVLLFGAMLFSWLILSEARSKLSFWEKEVSKKSILRTIAFPKESKEERMEEPLQIYRVVPFIGSFIISIIYLLLLALHTLSLIFNFPIGIAIGNFLDSTLAVIIISGWFIYVVLYICILHILASF